MTTMMLQRKTEIIQKTIELRRSLNQKLARSRLHNHDFTLISQNCLGGVLYHWLGMEFLSPTINMFIQGENFVKLIENLSHYIYIDAKPGCDCFVDPIDPNIHYPIITVDDIELCCLHYKNCQEAIEKWNERRKRVNLDNVYVIATSWNLNNDISLAKRIVESPFRTVVFSSEKWNDLPNCVALSGSFWKIDKRGIVRPNLTDYKEDKIHYYFEEQFDFIKWLNS